MPTDESAVGSQHRDDSGPLKVSKYDIPAHEYGLLFAAGMLASMIVVMLTAAVTESAGASILVGAGASMALAVYCLYLKFTTGGDASP